jgi:preprotein translocase subunit YajC
MSIVLLILLFVVAWVVLILPKQRELKRHNALVAGLAEGDEVMSGSGIYGTITAIHGDVIHLEVAPDIEIRIARRAVATKVSVDELEAADEDDDELDEDEVGALEAAAEDETEASTSTTEGAEQWPDPEPADAEHTPEAVDDDRAERN